MKRMIQPVDLYPEFMPLRQSSTLEGVDSYSDFMPLRQSSTLGDDTLPMNDTDVYAHTSVVWDYGFQAAQREKKRIRAKYNAVNDQVLQETLCVTMPDDTLNATLDTTVCKNSLSNVSAGILQQSTREDISETLYTTALDISFNEDDDDKYELGNISINECADKSQLDNTDESLNETLPLDDDTDATPLNDAFVITEF